MKKSFNYILAIIILVLVICFSFHFFNNISGQKNGFQRVIKEVNLDLTRIFLLPNSSFYFAGTSKRKLLLRDLKNDSAVFSIDYSLSGLQRKDLKINKDLGRSVTIGVNDSSIYRTTNRSGSLSIFSRNTDDVKNFESPEIMFLHSALISNSTITGVSALLKDVQPQRILAKLNYVKNIVEKKYILEKQVDGFFCTDGMLLFEPLKPKLLYMYFYRGEFLCLDTNLSVVYKTKTIDTVKKAIIKIFNSNKTINNKSEAKIIQSTPPKVVNRNFIVSNDYVYIMSALKADNESYSDFKKNQVIDVYAINNGKYLYSFYIPKYKDHKLREFRIVDDFVFAIFHDSLIKYKLRS